MNPTIEEPEEAAAAAAQAFSRHSFAHPFWGNVSSSSVPGAGEPGGGAGDGDIDHEIRNSVVGELGVGAKGGGEPGGGAGDGEVDHETGDSVVGEL